MYNLTHMSASCHAHEYVMSHAWGCHVAHVNRACVTHFLWVSMWHIWMIHVTHTNRSCHAQKRVVSHLQIAVATLTNQSHHTWEWVPRQDFNVKPDAKDWIVCCNVLQRVETCFVLVGYMYTILWILFCKPNLEDWEVCCSVLLCVAVWSITVEQIYTILYQPRFSTVSETWPSGFTGWRWNLLHMFFGDRQVHDDPLQYVVECCSMWCCSVSILLLDAVAFDDFLGHASL